MERKFINGGGVIIECTVEETSYLLFAVKETLSNMDAEGMQDATAYKQLKALEAAFKE